MRNLGEHRPPVLGLERPAVVHRTVEELAQWAGTIPYEILAGISARVPRIYEQ